MAGVSLLWVLLQGVATAAPAESRSGCVEAFTKIQRGVRLRLGHQDEAALSEFQQAQELCPGPRALAQMALAEQALGRWLQAEQHLGEALAQTDNRWIRQRRAQLEAALGTIRQHVGSLQVEMEPADRVGAELQVNGATVGALPLGEPVRVVAGTITVTVRAPGCVPVTRQVVVPPGGLARETVSLVLQEVPPPKPAPPPAVVTLPASPAPSVPQVDVSKPQPAPVVRSRRAMLLQRLGIAAVSVGAVVLGGGVAAHAVREQNARAWNRDDACVYAPAGPLPAQCQARLNAVTVGQRLAIVGYAVGGALAGAGVVLLALPASRGREKKAQTWLTVQPGPGVGWAGQF
jgi:hypothetical protein